MPESQPTSTESVRRTLAATTLLLLMSALGAPPVRGQAAEEAMFLNQTGAPRRAPSRAGGGGGGGGSVEGASAAPPEPYAASDGDAEGRLGSEQMRRANRVASGILRERMNRERPEDLARLEEARTAQVIVVQGTYDRVQDVLRAIEVDHVVISPHMLNRLPLMSTQTVMVNCPGGLSSEGTERIARFVEGGGYLVTTDWALNLVGHAFPGTVRRGGRNTGNDVVQVHIHGESEHPFIQRVQATEDDPRWWLEDSSYPIHVLDPRRVEVLISSEQMRRRYGQPAIAVTFHEGDGQVLHTTSHFYLQQSRLTSQRERAQASNFARDVGLDEAAIRNLRARGLDEVRVGEVVGAFAMQQLLTNVIVDKQRMNVELLARYALEATRAGSLRAEPTAGAEELGAVGEAFLLRELDRREGWVHVRDLFGRDGWLEADALRPRAAQAAPAQAQAQEQAQEQVQEQVQEMAQEQEQAPEMAQEQEREQEQGQVQGAAHAELGLGLALLLGAGAAVALRRRRQP